MSKVVNDKTFFSTDFYTSARNIVLFVSVRFLALRALLNECKKLSQKIQWRFFSHLFPPRLLLMSTNRIPVDAVFLMTSTQSYQTSCEFRRIIRTRISQFSNICAKVHFFVHFDTLKIRSSQFNGKREKNTTDFIKQTR